MRAGNYRKAKHGDYTRNRYIDEGLAEYYGNYL